MQEHNGKRIVVLSPDMMVNMFMSSYKANLTYYDEEVLSPDKAQTSRIYNSSTPAHKEKKLRRNKKKSQR